MPDNNSPTSTHSPTITLVMRYMIFFLLASLCAYVLYMFINTFSKILIPLSLSILISALLTPLVNLLQRWKIPRILAVLLSLLLFICLFAGVISLISFQVSADWNSVRKLLLDRVRDLQHWLTFGPLHMNSVDITSQFNKIIDFANHHSSSLMHIAQNGLSESLNIIAKLFEGFILLLFCSIFLLYDGSTVGKYIITIVPPKHRERAYQAGRVGFGSLVAYVRATFLVAGSDAIIVYIGLTLVQVPLAAPLALIVFLGAFIPLVGALVAGMIAVAIALLTKGIIGAIVTAIIILIVIQIEGHVLQPFLLGRAVSIHPLAVLLAITAGGILFHIWGAFIAVPIVAVGHTSINYLRNSLPTEVEKKIDKELSAMDPP